MDSLRLIFPATMRNREPIAALLAQVLPSSGVVLELASGSGEHAVFFQRIFPSLLWQPSDPDPRHRQSIDSWVHHEGLSTKMPAALDLDVLRRPWPLSECLAKDLRVIVCINLLHVSSLSCTNALTQEAGRLLEQGGQLIIYGPFNYKGQFTSTGNMAFDTSLRSHNPLWGIRDQEWVEQQASNHGFELLQAHSMPAHNTCLQFIRRA
ncbi:hypothetical protein OMCYN_01788 [cyanobiont of Ornithocercus magnificus]|nr:hypothetical protein OMCYN_01788 [cyanobiont of Ornithocercus magnificus]